MGQNNIKQNDVEDLLSSYISSPIVQELHNYYSEPSLLDILHVDRKENYHSNFLKWLFEDADLYKKSNQYLLVLLLRRAKQQSSLFPDWLKTALLTNSFHIDSVKVKIEDSVEDKNAKAKGRCDILIEILCHCNQEESKKIHVFIENKIYSDEHEVGQSKEKQTMFYNRTYKERYDNCIFVYLNLINSLELNEINAPRCECKEFVQINYQDLLDHVLTSLINDASIEQRKQFIIREYIKALSTNYSKNRSIMAIDSKLSELLINFWNNNHSLIELSIKALANDPTLDYEVRMQVDSVDEKLQELKNKRDDTQYVFNRKEYKVKMSLVRDVLELQKSNNMDVNSKWEEYLSSLELNDFDSLFNSKNKWTKDNHEITDNEKKEIINNGCNLQKSKKPLIRDKNFEDKKYNKYYDNSSFYRQWGWKNFDYFIKFCRETLKIEIEVR